MNRGEDAADFELDRRALARSFDRAAPHYEAAATLQQQIREELLNRLDYFTLSPRWILDLGAGTGAGARSLRRRFQRARVLALDIAPCCARCRAAPGPGWHHASSGCARMPMRCRSKTRVSSLRSAI
jgi:malonyl-CoA O-methyltransferase